MKARSAREKGNRLERKVASALGGRRAPLSGAVGGGDVWITEGLWADWLLECKARKELPALIKNALLQAEAGIGQGSPRKPAVVLQQDRGKPIFVAYLDDLRVWVEAIAEMGNGHRVKTFLHEARRALDAAERNIG